MPRPSPDRAAASAVRRRGARWLPAAAVASACAATLACGGSAVPAEWTLELEELVTVGRDPVTVQTAFYMPTDLGTDAAGNVHVRDTGNRRVQVFDPVGDFLFAFGEYGPGDGRLVIPRALTVAESPRTPKPHAVKSVSIDPLTVEATSPAR